ncbi:LADA_0E10638g1_1 [Lachancea dasiensis]|uniref:LADA_0E10638g1_1 n=1 Tax=Lachancea dasiensis TaxID=1072105 RepID=A0A1G4JEX0_9SACH|nr:LADA_0E10638g1_1 [Lachancea dasiensis]
MLTPGFKVSQDEEFLHLCINIAMVRFNAPGMEMVVDDTLFIFHLSPYYLRLRFSQSLVDDERCKAEFKAQDESIRIQIPKLHRGQHFEDLDLPTKLLARQGDLAAMGVEEKTTHQPLKGPLIQEVDSTDAEKDPSVGGINEAVGTAPDQDLRQIGEQFDWELKQTPAATENSFNLLTAKYGFDDKYERAIGISVVNGNDINELDQPDKSNYEERIQERLRKENLKFDPEYYVSEYMTAKYGNEDDLEINGIRTLLKFTPPLAKSFLKWYKNAEDKDGVMDVQFSEIEQKQMRENLPNKRYMVDDAKRLYLTILSLLFAYNFEQTENEGVHNTESAWTIGKLAPQIAFLDQQIIIPNKPSDVSIIKAIVVTGFRRSLSYPLHRNYELSAKVWNYVYYILRGGKRLVIKALLDIHEVFRFHDVYYVYNTILLNDLCSWFISEGNENVIRSLAITLKNDLDGVKKEDIDFDCVCGVDEETSQVSWENLTVKEMEHLAEEEYLQNNDSSQQVGPQKL